MSRFEGLKSDFEAICFPHLTSDLHEGQVDEAPSWDGLTLNDYVFYRHVETTDFRTGWVRILMDLPGGVVRVEIEDEETGDLSEEIPVNGDLIRFIER